MFENLSCKIERAFKKLKGSHKITELNIAEMMKEIRRALVAAFCRNPRPAMTKSKPLCVPLASAKCEVCYTLVKAEGQPLGGLVCPECGKWQWVVLRHG